MQCHNITDPGAHDHQPADQGGCWDGTIACWRVGALLASAGDLGSSAGPGQRSLQLLLHFPAADGPVRALAWAPAQLAGTTSDSAHRHLVAAVGHTTYLRVWDLR